MTTISVQPDSYFGGVFHASTQEFDPESPMGTGDTPEQAIADLWEKLPIEVGDEVVVVNRNSAWFGQTGRVERIHQFRDVIDGVRFDETTYNLIVNRCEPSLPFGASEVAR